MDGEDTVALLTPAREGGLDDVLAAALGRGAVRLVVDLTDAGPLDGRTLRTLVLGDHAARDRDGRLVVLCPAGPARATLCATGLDGPLTVTDTRALAERAARSAT